MMNHSPVLFVTALLWTLLASTHVDAQASSYYVEAGTYGTRRESDPPSYVRNLGEHPALHWLDLGLDYRARYEYRDDDIRRLASTGLDDPLLRRTRLYLGIHTPLEPLKLVVEFEDARRSNSRFPVDNRDVNKREFIQGYASLHYPAVFGRDARGNDRPLGIRAGRMAFELLDRRLAGRNEWRNTTNNFDGVRVSLGQETNDWQLELMRLAPVTRLISATDTPDRNLRFDAVIGHWRTGAPAVTVEPFYMRLVQDPAPATGNHARDIHSPGLRVYGLMADAAVNYDISFVHQSGTDGMLDHEAYAFTLEAGHTWLQHPWHPRLSLFYGHASGDKDPADGSSGRFERFFGFARPWSANDYVVFENLKAPKLRVEFEPLPGIRIDTGYSAYWLASDSDRFNNLLAGASFNRDATGNSGNFVGQEVDVRARFSLNAHTGINIGYAHFKAGNFVQQRQRAANGIAADDSDFLYLELTLSLF